MPFKVMSTIASHLPLNISETVRHRCFNWFHKTTNGKWPMKNRMVTWSMTSRDPERSSRDHNLLRAQYLENDVADDVTWPERCWEAIRWAILATPWPFVYLCAKCMEFVWGFTFNRKNCIFYFGNFSIGEVLFLMLIDAARRQRHFVT